MEVILVAKKIQYYIELLNRYRKRLEKQAKTKAEALANYEKALAKTILRLRSGDLSVWEGITFENPPAGVLERLAKGICAKERIEAEQQEAAYKALVTNIEAIEAILNGYQSLFRHLREEVG